MDILILDPFFEYSHKVWSEGLQKHSSHKITILSLSPHHWKWRMTGGAIELAEQYKNLNLSPDLIIATDMLDFACFLALAKIDQQKVSTAIYFHENQITYPWKNETTKHQKEKNHHYSFINFVSCLSADKVFFNSAFHKSIFNNSLPGFLKMLPKFGYQKYLESISSKSMVLPLGLDVQLNRETKAIKSETPCFLWNHRWEHDKNPELFFNTLFQLKEEKIPFELIVLGKSYKRQPAIFEEAKEVLNAELLHFGYVDTYEEYHTLVEQTNILLVTSNQDFFGISIVEAIASGLYPILPDRLAYPEHIPLDLHHKYLYQKDEAIIPMLKEIILNKKFLEDSPLPSFVQKYNWRNLIELYDNEFSKL